MNISKLLLKDFFKEKIKFYGVKTSYVTILSKESYETIKGLEKKELFSLCELLLESGYIEETFIAFKWAEYMSTGFEKEDFEVLEAWLHRYVTNWATCDTLCNYANGNFLEMYPVYISRLKEWTKSDNRWVRRGAATSLVFQARKGLFLSDILEISSLLLQDEDDLVQKGYGWMLKEASRLHQKEVFEYLMENRERMKRTSFRYALEKMSDELRSIAMN